MDDGTAYCVFRVRVFPRTKRGECFGGARVRLFGESSRDDAVFICLDPRAPGARDT